MQWQISRNFFAAVLTPLVTTALDGANDQELIVHLLVAVERCMAPKRAKCQTEVIPGER